MGTLAGSASVGVEAAENGFRSEGAVNQGKQQEYIFEFLFLASQACLDSESHASQYL